MSANERAHLAQLGKIKVCVDPDYLPFERIESGRHIGIAAEFLDEYSRWLNTPLELVVSSSWTQTANNYEQGRCDIVSLLNQTAERERYLNFSSPYISVDLFIVARTDTGFISGLIDLSGKTLAIVNGYRFEALIRDLYPDINVILVASTDEALRRVDSGEIFATVDSLHSSLSSIARLRLHSVGIVGQTMYSDDFRIGVRKDDALLWSAIEKAVAALPKARANAILEQGFRLPTVPTESNWIAWPLIGGLALLTVVCLILAWQSRRYSRDLAQKNAELERAIETDYLTQAFNRLKMERCISTACAQANRHQHPLCLIMIDIDHFKKINDHYGHGVGDLILMEFCKLIGEHIRAGDMFGRWGGEEFILCCPHTSREQATAFCEKLCALVAAQRFHSAITLTSSFGLSPYIFGESSSAFIKRTDAALYEAKHNGRNRVESLPM